jgi:thiol-disulfide isomerase/thioredoxin
MQVLKFIAILLTVSIVAGCDGKKETVITGAITGKPDLKTVVYTAPLSGTSFGGFGDTLYLDEAGNFELKLAINQPSFIKMWETDAYTAVKILIEPRNNYHIAMDVPKKDIQISGANEKGQMLYASLPDPSFVEMEARRLKLLDDTSLVSIRTKVEELKQSDLSRFKELLDNGEISQSFFNLIKIDRNCYYAAREAIVSVIKSYRMVETKQFVLPGGEHVLENLTKIYTQYPPNSEQLVFSSFWTQYAEYYIKDYKPFIRDDFDMQKLNDLHTDGMIHAFHINESKNCLTGKALEFYQAAYLYFTGLQANYEKELIALFEQFGKDYPDSEYTKYIKPMIDETVRYHQIIEKPFDETVLFADGYENINTLEEALNPLKGKKIYIDVWATWCGPCKKEFKHQQALKKILDQQNIQQLYISIDEDNRDRQWKENIKFYGLSGTHIRASKELFMDLYKRFDKKAKIPYISIPWYILVDENGHIIREHAGTPSKIIAKPSILDEMYH